MCPHLGEITMEQVGIRILKNNLSKYLKMAKGGTNILITHNNKPIAKLIPYQYHNKKDVITLVEEGIASWGGGKPHGSTAPIHTKGTKTAAERVIEDRR